MDDLLKRFGFAPVGFEIFSLGDGEGLLTAADETTFLPPFDRITAAARAGVVRRRCAAVSDVIIVM